MGGQVEHLSTMAYLEKNIPYLHTAQLHIV